MQLQGKKVVVIGGSSGIGLAIARQAQTAGASLIIVGRTATKVSDATTTLGADAQGIVTDAHDHSALEKLFGTLPAFDHPSR